MADHQLTNDVTGLLKCEVCGQYWKKPPTSQCIGVKIVQWGSVGDTLLTEKQMKERRLIPGQPRAALPYSKSSTGYLMLYDPNEATPKPEMTNAQKEGLAKAADSRRRAMTCFYCGREFSDKEAMWQVGKKGTMGTCFSCGIKEKRRRDRAVAVAWAQEALAEGFLILDTETTGTDYDSEILAITVINHRGDVLLDTLIKPQDRIREVTHTVDYDYHDEEYERVTAFGVNGISNAMVADAPSFADIYPQLCDLLFGQTVIAYNARFDRGRIEFECERANLLPPVCDWHCAMLEFAAWQGAWHDYYESWRWWTLDTAVSELGGHLEQAHEAKADCFGVLAVVKGMAWHDLDAAYADMLPLKPRTVEGCLVDGVIVGKDAWHHRFVYEQRLHHYRVSYFGRPAGNGINAKKGDS